MVVKLNGNDKVEVVEGSFVWLQDAKLQEGEVCIEWDSIEDTDKITILSLRDKIDALTGELAELLVTIGNNSDNSVKAA